MIYLQLVTFVNELVNNGIETDVIAMDLSKAFDTVPHKRLMEKLKFNGINAEPTSIVDQKFLCYQKHIVDGWASEFANAISGVPQSTVSGPILLLIYMNDLPDNLKSPVRL